MERPFHDLKGAIARFVRRQPWMILSTILIVLILLEVANAALHRAGFPLRTPRRWFPISVFCGGPQIHWHAPFAGLPHALLFVLATVGAVYSAHRLRLPAVLALCAVLLLLGNMVQSEPASVLTEPFTALGNQYYHDAVTIDDAVVWLRKFNENQAALLCHSRTHPPFAVLLHWLFLVRGKVTILAWAFLFFSFLQFPIFWTISKLATGSRENANLLTVLYSVLPAVNIYSVMCLDAIIAVAFLLTLLGLLLVDRRLSVGNVTLYTLAFLAANALTFGGVFLCAVSLLVGVYLAAVRSQFNVLIAFAAAFTCALLCCLLSSHVLGYDHWEAFLTACRLDTPLVVIEEPWSYFGTRIEGISEILLFLGLGTLALVIKGASCRLGEFSRVTAVGAAGSLILLLLLAAGAFCTGETARCCMFIYPYILLLVMNSPKAVLRDMIVWSAMQTVLMQTLGSYFW